MKRKALLRLKKAALLIMTAFILLPVAAAFSSCTPGGDGESKAAREADIYVKKELQTMDLYRNGYNNNMIVGFDNYGRTVEAAAGKKEKRDVGIFYFLWLGQPYASGIYDVSKIIDEHGKDVVFHEEGGDISPNGQAHWWEEPLYGYYNSADRWVLRRHMEMLTEAGVDFLIFDTTNCVLYEEVATAIMQLSQELRDEGWDAPQVAFYTHSRSIQTINNIYNTFYRAGRYKDSWYCIDGRPMIIGYTTALKDRREAKSRGDTAYAPEDLSQELQDFFYVKEACWPNDFHNANSFPYTEWVYPQPLNGNTMNVSVATHPMVPFSFSLTHENWCNWGRGYDVVTGENKHEDIYRGTFFQSEWETVHASDPQPEIIMVTGWNEWIAYKQPYGGEYMLCDNVDMEYSRDIEPMKGGYEDAYFIQMISNIRKYKYESSDEALGDNVYKTVDIAGPASEWDDVKAVYRRVGNDNTRRDYYGGSQTVRYKTPAADNNILTVRLTNDSENLFFRIECEGDVNVTGKSSWMNLFIGTGKPGKRGWESYEYVAGRVREDMNAASGVADVEKLAPDFSGKKSGEAEFAVSGNAVTYKVPLSALGLQEGGADVLRIYFKVADGVENSSDIMDYYCTGRSLPMGRLSFEYKFRR
ncbi:MAG: hypothetical protein J6Y21_04885 [Clostridia bacterium]|nr:hypothetical protein [Clostridia bacterium]